MIGERVAHGGTGHGSGTFSEQGSGAPEASRHHGEPLSPDSGDMRCPSSLMSAPVPFGRTRATFPEEVMAHAVAPGAIAGVIAVLVSDAAAPVSGAIRPAYGA